MAYGIADTDQLYQLSNDVGQQQNIANQYPQKAQELKTSLENISGRKFE